jgi:hypothetical protein
MRRKKTNNSIELIPEERRTEQSCWVCDEKGNHKYKDREASAAICNECLPAYAAISSFLADSSAFLVAMIKISDYAPL